MTSLEEAITELYRIARIEKKTTSTLRLRKLADFCAIELAGRGIPNAEAEAIIHGWVRAKRWDVVQRVADRVRAAISLKSMLGNLSGATPNRTDELIGEVADVQMRYPEIVLGYMIIMDESEDRPPGPTGKWIGELEQRLGRMSGRRAPFWAQGTLEASVVIRVDFAEGPIIRTPTATVARFFDQLASEYRARS